MSILVIGDQHFKIDNLEECEVFIERVEQQCTLLKPKYIVLLGDLLHTHEKLHTTVLNKALQFIDRMRSITKTFVLVGNHDMVSCSQFLSDNHWLNSIKEWENVVIVDTVVHFAYDSFNIVLSPFVPNGRFIEAMNTLTTFDWRKADVIFAHQEFKGCKMGMMISEDGDEWDLSYPHVISGHIHQKQTPQKNIYYTGSPVQHAYGESVDNTISSIELQKNVFPYLLKEIDLDVIRKKIVYIDIDDVNCVKLPQKSNEHIKITISGDYEQFKTFKKTNRYKELSENKQVKISFKQVKPETMLILEPDQHIEFKDILLGIVLETKDAELYKAYEKIVNKKDIGDVLIL